MKLTLIELNPAGGLFQFAFQLGTALAERGHEVTLVTGPDPELRSTQANFVVADILPTWRPGSEGKSRWRRRLRRIPRALRHVASLVLVARHLRRQRPDIVQWASWRFAIDGINAALVARSGWCGASVDLCHEPRPLQEQRSATGSYYRAGPLLRWGLDRGYGSMATTVVLGESARRDLTDSWPAVKRCDVVPHGDEGAFGDASELPVPSASVPNVLLFGTLTSYKGIDDLLDAWPLVLERIPQARLRIAGDPSADLDVGALRVRVAASRGVEVDLRYVPLPSVKELFAGSALAVAPYRRSNASGAVRLAQTMGRPVVVTRVGDLADSVEDGVSGRIVEPGMPSELAGAIADLLDDPPALDAMGAAGRRNLRSRSSWPIVAAALEQIYLDVLQEAR